MLALFVHLLRMVKWHDLIPFTVDYKNRAVDVLNAVNIRELVKGQRPPQVKEHSERAHETTVYNDASNRVFFCQVAGGTRTD